MTLKVGPGAIFTKGTGRINVAITNAKVTAILANREIRLFLRSLD